MKKITMSSESSLPMQLFAQIPVPVSHFLLFQLPFAIGCTGKKIFLLPLAGTNPCSVLTPLGTLCTGLQIAARGLIFNRAESFDP